MIAAMANAGIVFERPAWIELARRAFDFIRRQMTGPMGVCCTAGGPAVPGIRRVSTTMPISAARRLRFTKQPATKDFLSQARDWVTVLDRALLGRGRGRLFLCGQRYRGADRPRQDRRRFCRSRRQRHPGRGADPAGDPDRRRSLSPPRRGDRRDLFRRNRRATSFRSPPCSTMSNCWKSRCRSSLSEKRALRRSTHCVAPSTTYLCRIGWSSASPPEARSRSIIRHIGKGLVDDKPAAYVCDGPVCSLPVTDAESLLESLARVR